MKKFHAFIVVFGVLGLSSILAQSTPPPNDNFDSRAVLDGTNASATVSNESASKEPGEPDILGNAGGKSVWWTWTAPQNGSVTIKTEGSGFDTLLAVYTGDSLSNLVEVASGDDSLGSDPLTSVVTFHAQMGDVFQIAVDGYRGFDGQVATGTVVLSLDFVYDRYTISCSLNDTNRGFVTFEPPPDMDGKYLTGTEVRLIGNPLPGWYFGSWSGDINDSNNPVALTLSSNVQVVANFDPVLINTVGRSPSSVEVYTSVPSGNLALKVWCPEIGTLNYQIETDVTWLTVYPTNGTSRGETNTHTIGLYQVSQLKAGNYNGTILIRPMVDGAQFASVAVSMCIDPSSSPIMWQTNNDIRASGVIAKPTEDGGFVVAGSVDGASRAGPGFGGYDFAVLRLDKNGYGAWTNCFGGEAGDILEDLQQTSDGGFVLAGTSYSGQSGSKTSTNFGMQDIWIVRVNASGEKLWNRNFGGTDYDYNPFIKQTSDGGFVVACNSMSGPSGNKTSTNWGSIDYWVIRLDANGKRLWDKSFGGDNSEYLKSLEVDADGNITLLGNSSSYSSGNKTNSGPGAWIVWLDRNGEKVRELGDGMGMTAIAIQQVADGGYLTIGTYAYRSTYYLSRFDSTGYMRWQTPIQLWVYSTIKLLSLHEEPNGNINVYATRQSCCGSDYSCDLLVFDASGQLVRIKHLYGDLYINPVTLAFSQTGNLLLCSDRFEMVMLKSFGNIRPASFPMSSPYGYHFLYPGEVGQQYLTEISTNLINWTSFGTNVVQGKDFEIFDLSVTNAPMKFYRTRPLQP